VNPESGSIDTLCRPGLELAAPQRRDRARDPLMAEKPDQIVDAGGVLS